MSLLLDALKKAADDKKKASQGGSAEPGSLDAARSDTGSDARVAHKAVAKKTEELTLDPIETNIVESRENVTTAENMAPESETGNVHGEVDELSLKQDEDHKDSNAAGYTVSDEALSMLIHKTNRDVKHSKRLVLISVLLISLVILSSGGVYHYMEMQAEISSLERKHQIAMMAMVSKTNKEKTPEKSEIIRSLVSESGLDDKVQNAKKHLAEEKNTQQVKHRSAAERPVNAEINNNKTSGVSPAVSFQKTNKADPVAEKLEQAWLAYEATQYEQAKKLYNDVLSREKNNRDALLGLGAIAVVEKNTAAARKTYLTLLEHDPRDSIAIAALASLRNSEVSTETDEKYMLNMLQKNPDDAHLNFALGNIYAQQNKWKLAQQSYFNAWQRDNENADYIFNLAVTMDQLGKRQQAVGFYQDSLSKSDNRQVSFSREAVQKRIAELSGL